MSQKQTSPRSDGLSAIQHDAIRLLASGCTPRYTALVLRLKHAQVRKWMKEDAHFQTELASRSAQQTAQAPDEGRQPKGEKESASKSQRAATKKEKTQEKLISG